MSGDRAAAANARLARTINVGLALGAPAEEGWTVPVTDSVLDRCAEAGFTAIRLVTTLAAHRQPNGSIVSSAIEAIDEIATAATARGLAIVVANFLDPELMTDPSAHHAISLAGIRQLATTLTRHGPDVVFEPLAEPQGALDDVWNAYLSVMLGQVRAIDPDRTLIVGPKSYNNARFLPELTIPDDANLIVTIHHYWPITFTLQGETWMGTTEFGDPASWLGNTWEGTASQRAELQAGFDAVADYAAANNRPIFMGEFGTTTHAESGSRVRWTRFNRELAETRGFSWGCWSYGPSFALVDNKDQSWNQHLLAALVPHNARESATATDADTAPLRARSGTLRSC